MRHITLALCGYANALSSLTNWIGSLRAAVYRFQMVVQVEVVGRATDVTSRQREGIYRNNTSNSVRLASSPWIARRNPLCKIT